MAATMNNPTAVPHHRQGLYDSFGLDELQRQLADFLFEVRDSVRAQTEADGSPPYAAFPSEAEARFCWGLYSTTKYDRLRPFPGDHPKGRKPGKSAGSGLFERVKSAVSVQELAEKFTELTPTGRNRLKGRCPVHDERTPSFYVFTESDHERWHCFGACAHGGDVIALAQELMNRGKL